MRVTDLPPEILREIIKLSADSQPSFTPSCAGTGAGGISSPPMMSFDSYKSKNGSREGLGRSYFVDRLKVALVCRTFWEIGNEFLYAAVSLSKPSQAVNLAHGLAKHATKCNPAPGTWVKELEVKSYFELDQSTAGSLKCILQHCTRLVALRISGSFLDRQHPSEITHILSAIQRGVVHFEFDAISIFSRRDREHAHAENGLYEALERLRSTLQTLKLPASRYLYLFTGRSNVLVGITRLELCFSSPDLQMMSNAYDNPSIASWSLESLTHLTLSYIPPNRDDTPVKFFLSMPSPSFMLFPISRRVSFPLHELLAAAPNLQELDYRPFSLRTTSLWRHCSSSSLRHIIIRADGVSYTELYRNQMFESLREQVQSLASKEAFPALANMTVSVEHPCISLEIIARSLRSLKEAQIGINSEVLPSDSRIDFLDLMTM